MQDDPLSNLSIEEKQILAEWAKSKTEGRISKRDFLKAGGALGIGAALGGGAQSAVGNAQAAAGTGNIGTAANPLDTVFANNVGTASEPVQSISTDSVNNVLYADTGELQSVLASATANDTVKLHPGKAYDPGSETTIPQDVTLDFNGATFEPSSDYPGFFLEFGATLLLGYGRGSAILPSGYTSDVVLVDASRAAGNYRVFENTEVHVDLDVYGAGTGTGTGIHIVSDGANNVTVGNTFRLKTRLTTTAFKAEALNGGYTAGCELELFSHHDVQGFYATQSGGGQNGMTVRGVIQPGANSTHGMYAEGGTKPVFFGAIWDPTMFSTSSVRGSFIYSTLPLSDFQTTLGPGATVFGFEADGSFGALDGASDDYWVWEAESGSFLLRKNGSTVNAATSDGDWRVDTAGKGVRVKTPDGSDFYRIRVDNSGNVVTDLI